MPSKMKTPVIRNLKTLFSQPVPREPVILHLTSEQWESLSRDIPISKKRIRKDAKGMFVIPDPFGGYLGFLACAAGSDEGVACIPEIVRPSTGTITFGRGCTCLRGRDPVDRTPQEPEETCTLTISTTRGFQCTGNCGLGRSCQLVRGNMTGGKTFLRCECS